MLSVLTTYAADNEIHVDQSGATANIDLEQLGSGNIIGGLNSSAGSLTALDLDGTSLTLDINQIGDTNKFLGDILGDSVTGFFDFDINYDGGTSYVDVDGDSNTLNFTGSGYAGGYFYLDQTGNSRTFNITQSSTQDNDWLKIISNGSNGTVCVIQNDQGTGVGC